MTGQSDMTDDTQTAAAFASSWNNLPGGSVYTPAQFEDWFAPLTRQDAQGKRVLELGCGNGSLLVHMAGWQPRYLEGVDLGDSVRSATRNMETAGHPNWSVKQGDLTAHESEGFDLVYCIGVLHHLKEPKKGLDAVVRNTLPGGRFHCWVYGYEGNALVRLVVEPLRLIASRLPWWVTKYLIATPAVAPYFVYAKLLRAFGAVLPRAALAWLPLYDYSMWIAQRGFLFFRHVAFDQLVTPQTVYVRKETIESWLASYAGIEPGSAYVIQRNGNSWKFGARLRA
jgi:SAM-dependent methyltransferase